MKFQIDPVTSRFMDAIRGVSALTVLVVHTLQVFVLPYFGLGSAAHIYSSFVATHAVTVFFVISGFMICLSVQRHRSASGSFDGASFAAARILRIYPPLIAALLITISVYLVIVSFDLHGARSYRLGGELFVARERVMIEWSALPATVLLLYGAVPHAPPPLNMNGPLWTLGYEFWFYILTFLSAVSLMGKRCILGAVPLVLVITMLLYGRNALFLRFLLIWSSGFVLALLLVRGDLSGPRFKACAGFLAVLGILLIAYLGGPRTVHDLLHPFESSEAQNIMMIVGFLLAIGVAAGVRASLLHGLQVPGWFARPAAFAYTLYIVHYPLLLLAYSLLHPLTHGQHWVGASGAGLVAAWIIIVIAARLAQIVENRSLLKRAGRNLLARFGLSIVG
jgi:peptidoglycan/LPS O-acetylase OafA/YrhL